MVVLGSVFSGLSWFNGVWPSLIAGLAGPALVRSQLAVLGSGQETAHYGPANVFVRLQKTLDRMIDECCSIDHAPWLTQVAIPKLATSCSVSEVAQIATTYIRGASRMSAARKRSSAVYIKAVVADATNDDEKMASIVQHVVDIGGLRLIKRLVKGR
jgi:hypothetical protein